jgi:hypothetical protein
LPLGLAFGPTLGKILHRVAGPDSRTLGADALLDGTPVADAVGAVGARDPLDRANVAGAGLAVARSDPLDLADFADLDLTVGHRRSFGTLGAFGRLRAVGTLLLALGPVGLTLGAIIAALGASFLAIMIPRRGKSRGRCACKKRD